MTESAASVYKKYLRPEVINKISGLDLRAKRIVEGFLLGLHKSPYHGFSIEFSQHRPYQQGDALKDVDWKIYGKSDRFFVKQYEEETNLRCHIFVDCSASMNCKFEGQVTKYEYASMLSAALAYMLIGQKDAVGMTLYNEGILRSFPERSSTTHLRDMLLSLAAQKPGKQTRTAETLYNAAGVIKRRSLVVLISDFFDDPEKIIQGLKRFRFAGNEVVLFQILDPVELTFSFGGDAKFVDVETGESMVTNSFQISEAYRNAMKEYLHSVKSEALKNGVEYNLIATNETFDKALTAYLQKRMRLG